MGCAHLNPKVTHTLINPFSDLIPSNRSTNFKTETCPAVPYPVIDVMSETYYKDSHHSIIDIERHELSQKMVTPLRMFNNQVVRLADRLWKFNDLNAESCLYTWLSSWANAGALLGDANYQGEFERKWNLSGIALAYLKVENIVHWTAEQKSLIVEWIAKIAKRVRFDYDQKLDRQSRRNNHIYWAGLSVLAVSLITQDQELFDWGISKGQKGIMDVTPEGFLPEELDRARRARHYQSFALQALTMISFLAEKNGVDLYLLKNGALGRLAKKTIEGYQNPSIFKKATGVDQEPIDLKDLDWTFAYLYRYPNELDIKKFERSAPIFSPWLGGNLSLTFSNFEQD